MSCNLARSIWWSILSKALLRSRRTTAVSFFLSMAFRISSVVWMTDVSVECHCLFPLCLDDKRPLESRYDVSWLWATRSQTLERTGSNEIGLLLFGISWSNWNNWLLIWKQRFYKGLKTEQFTYPALLNIKKRCFPHFITERHNSLLP